jgi:tetratricopeptide (TPR) repeat protein
MLFCLVVLFLTNIRENHDQAEEHYKKSLELGPDNAIVNGNYALFLTNFYYCLHDQDQVLGLFYNAFLLGHNLCEYSLKRMRNCH